MEPEGSIPNPKKGGEKKSGEVKSEGHYICGRGKQMFSALKVYKHCQYFLQVKAVSF
jgi:hypothetical protein